MGIWFVSAKKAARKSPSHPSASFRFRSGARTDRPDGEAYSAKLVEELRSATLAPLVGRVGVQQREVERPVGLVEGPVGLVHEFGTQVQGRNSRRKILRRVNQSHGLRVNC